MYFQFVFIDILKTIKVANGSGDNSDLWLAAKWYRRLFCWIPYTDQFAYVLFAVKMKRFIQTLTMLSSIDHEVVEGKPHLK